MEETERVLRVGWAEAEITPCGRVLIAGLFHARLSEGVLDPLTATALALESNGEHMVLVSCDTVTIPDELRDAVRERLYEKAVEFDPMKVVLHATHTHTGPEIRVPSDTAGHTSVGGTGVELEATPVVEVIAFVADRIADAVVRAWNSRALGGFAFGLGYAVIGRNRRWIDVEGNAIKYDLTRSVCDRFRHIEGYEDHSVNIIATYDTEGQLTGLVVNVPCPPQLSESEFKLSADWWHEARQELRRRFGEELHVLPQCSAAGDLCPFPLYEQEGHARMQKLMGRTARQEVAERLASAVEEVLPHLAKAIDYAPVFRHIVQTVELTAASLTEEDSAYAKREAARWKEAYECELAKLSPASRDEPRWYVAATDAYRRLHWNLNVAHRFERQQTKPTLSAELHVVRLGDMAFASNPFEYYLDYGIQIKARSPAIQTFLIQLAGGGTYVPSPRSTLGGGYGSIPASNPVGPEGGQQLADETVAVLRRVWEECEHDADSGLSS